MRPNMRRDLQKTERTRRREAAKKRVRQQYMEDVKEWRKGAGEMKHKAHINAELSEMAATLQLEKGRAARYRDAWEAEKKVAKVWREENAAQRKVVSELRIQLFATRIALLIFVAVAFWVVLE